MQKIQPFHHSLPPIIVPYDYNFDVKELFYLIFGC
jgi:hypothetical protein